MNFLKKIFKFKKPKLSNMFNPFLFTSTNDLALSPIRVDEILAMRREPSAGAGLRQGRRSPSGRGRQHVQVTEPMILLVF